MKLQFLKSELDEYIQECGFTDSEVSVLLYKRRGFCVGDIATAMDYSEKTIHRITKSIVDKIIKYELTKKPQP